MKWLALLSWPVWKGIQNSLEALQIEAYRQMVLTNGINRAPIKPPNPVCQLAAIVVLAPLFVPVGLVSFSNSRHIRRTHR